MQTRKAYLYVFHTLSDWEYGPLIAGLERGRYLNKGLA
ncbi:glutamine amidotransferase, partial [Bacillus toyonensis]|nr:glutamine amidotransferase [Bacillus toyonensis]